MSNPYDLKKKKGTKPKMIAPPHKDTTPRADKIPTVKVPNINPNNSLLVGYKEVPNREKWGQLPIGAEIRYMKRDGTITHGGTIIRHGVKNENPYIVYYHSTYGNEVPLYHHKVQKIWAKPSPAFSAGLSPNSNNDTATALTAMKSNLKLMNEFMVMKYGEEYRNFMNTRQKQLKS